ncbi:hypothetical protein EMCG_01301 [[Emmonsia] crescens]|uniref:Uncharacterized protein n=1 Tax=[Emmonsia] crescens TaxID=73230 RepID=A0A0G2JA39_9EURO|nr:hypothetical protein EMCG_01301 [Emmonsia crescens UAMH 3008]
MSTTQDTALTFKRELVAKGVWAGHALDIIPLYSDHINGLCKDASDKVVRWIVRIYKAKFGEEWREKLIRASLMKGTLTN